MNLDVINKELLRYADADNQLRPPDLEECLRGVFDHSGIKYKKYV